MERILIYAAASAGIILGLVLYYHRTSPFPSRTYDKKPKI